ncbi:unnamed protein product [Cochlearia groenlandica]
MEQPKADTNIPIKDPNPNPSLTVDSKSATTEIALSDETLSQVEIDAKGIDPIASQAQTPTRTSSGSKKSVHWSPELVSGSQEADQNVASSYTNGSNPYIDRSPAESSDTSLKETMESVKGALGRWGKRVAEAAKKTESLAGNTWQHLRTAPSFSEAAMGRIAQSTKVLAEGGYEKIFRQTFETVPEEMLLNSFACYLSTSAGPVMGVLYISTAKLAYCSDNPLSYKNSGQTEWSYYKVIIPKHQLKAVNPSTSITNAAEKYIHVISVDNHEFWFMGFLNYDGAVSSLQDCLRTGSGPHSSV